MKNNSLRSGRMRGALSALLVLLMVSISFEAHAFDWESLKKQAMEYRARAEKKVDELMKLARQKWAEFRGDKVERQVSSESAPVPDAEPVAAAPVPAPTATPDQLTAIGAPISKDEKEDFKKLIETTRQELKDKEAIRVASPGRKGTSVLPATKAGVPKFDLTKKETKVGKDGKKKTVRIPVNDIPRLDIGEERSISKSDLVPPSLKVGFNKIDKPKALPSPSRLKKKELERWTKMNLKPLAPWKGIDRSKFGVGEIVTQQKVDAVDLTMKPTNALQAEKPVGRVTENELKMLGALILNKKGDKCHLVSGMFHELSKEKEFAEEANFHLGVCSHNMGFHSEAVKRLVDVVKSENPDYTRDAITNLVENLPREYDLLVADTLKNLKNKSFIADAAKDNVAYVMARAAHKRENYAEAAAQAALVGEGNPNYMNARYMLAVAQYAMKKGREAENTFEELREWMQKKKVSDKNMETLIAVNLARIRFTQKRYQAAHEEYMKVAKDHPLWVEALIEQGWTQLFTDDAAGAIGNMYSLHSPYFKSVYMPESWVVRTIGYIDICQYGDAYRTLSKLEQMHAGHLHSVNTYLTKFKSPEQYYNTVRNYIRGRSDQSVDGLPAQIIREIARQRGFLNVQEAINNKEDEIAQYKFIYGLILKDQNALKHRLNMAKTRLAKVNADLKKAEKDPALAKFINEWNALKRNETALIKNYEFQVGLYEKGRVGFNSLRSQAYARLDNEKSRLRTAAGKALMAHLRDAKKELEQIIESNEFLRYEIFAGSGENIRYQVTGGATAEGQRIPANVKPQKILNWEFDGEYWEDEIGSYRSTLKNNCPKNPRAAAAFNTTN